MASIDLKDSVTVAKEHQKYLIPVNLLAKWFV